MASFPNITITNAGLNMLAQAHDHTPLIFTKMQLGCGNLTEEQDIKQLTSLIQSKLNVPLNDIQFPATGQVKLRFSLSNITIEEGFFVREVGIFAKLGEDGFEQLYAYTNAGNLTDYLDSTDVPVNELFDIDVVVGNATVLNVLVKDEIMATKKDIEDHNQDIDAHADIFKNLTQFVKTTDFTGVFSDKGWCRFPNGLIFQWGKVVLGGDKYETVVFPIAFPKAILTITGSLHYSFARSDNGNSVQFRNLSLDNVIVDNQAIGSIAAGLYDAYWFAIGY